jgi:hypothetical protein
VASEATHQLSKGYFAFRPLGPTRVKGVSEPINVYEVTGMGPLQDPAAACCWARAHEVRRAQARDGRDAPRT